MIVENLAWTLPVLLGALLTSVITRKHKERERFNDAAAEFRAAFIEEQRLLDHNSFADRASAGSASSIIKNAIHNHERAMIKFEPFICHSRIEDYKKAWHDYAGDNNGFPQYTGDTAIKKEKGRKLALDRINNLLEFAKHK
jgi:hypothetical protein